MAHRRAENLEAIWAYAVVLQTKFPDAAVGLDVLRDFGTALIANLVVRKVDMLRLGVKLEVFAEEVDLLEAFVGKVQNSFHFIVHGPVVDDGLDHSVSLELSFNSAVDLAC